MQHPTISADYADVPARVEPTDKYGIPWNGVGYQLPIGNRKLNCIHFTGVRRNREAKAAFNLQKESNTVIRIWTARILAPWLW